MNFVETLKICCYGLFFMPFLLFVILPYMICCGLSDMWKFVWKHEIEKFLKKILTDKEVKPWSEFVK